VSDPGSFFAAIEARPHALVMGVLNVTPDSFSDGGRHVDPEAAASAGRRMLAEGAAILDVGGESTRPGATPVAPDEEWERVGPVLEQLTGCPLSIDTRNASTAARAIAAGAVLVNDVAGGADPEMLPTVASSTAGICLMHMQGEPGTMQAQPHYDDVVAEVERFLLDRAAAAEHVGIPRQRIVLDPGIGFGKTLEHNLALLRATNRLTSHGYPILLGVSRKRFLGDLTGRDVDARLHATTAAVTLAASLGAALVRVHDVAPAFDAVRVADALRSKSRKCR